MASIEKTPVFYASFTVINTGVDADQSGPTLLPAVVEQNYNSPIVSSAQDYILAVERFEININGIPFYDGAGETISVTNGTDTLSLADMVTYSLPDTLEQVFELFQDAADVRWSLISLEINSEGFVIWNLSDDAGGTFKSQYGFDFSGCPRLQGIFGMDLTQMADASTSTMTSAFPRFDCGDQLSYLRITSNLPTVSDSIGQAKGNVLTDLYFGKNIGASAELTTGGIFASKGISYSQRQKIIYNPQERRYLNMRSSRPIDDIRIECEYVKQDGSASIVLLPIGCEFTIKLGFWNLSNIQTPRDTNFNSKVVGGQRFVQF